MTQTLSFVEYYNARRPILEAAFNAVQNKVDWKSPISAIITEAKVDVTIEAIEFFTGTKSTLTKLGDGLVLIQSIGYRAGPAGDH